MTISGKPFPQRDREMRCMECGRAPSPASRKKRRAVLAMGWVPGFAAVHEGRRYRAVITPLTMRVQRLVKSDQLQWAQGRMANRYFWVDVQVIRRPKRNRKGEPSNLLHTLSDFESTILTGALARRLRDAARETAEATRLRRESWDASERLAAECGVSLPTPSRWQRFWAIIQRFIRE